MNRLVTRVARGLVVSTLTETTGAAAVTFVTDRRQPSGCNVVRVARGPARTASELHHAACTLASRQWVSGATEPKE